MVRNFSRFLVVLLCFSFCHLRTSSAACNGERRVFGQAYGNQTLGVIDSSQWRECEWLITSMAEAQQEPRSISLRLLSIDFRDPRAILYIFDGQSYEKRLIASLTANRSLSTTLVATSGFMLLVRYTPNPSQATFVAKFNISDCRDHCNGRDSVVALQQCQTVMSECNPGQARSFRCDCVDAARLGQWCNVSLAQAPTDSFWATLFFDNQILGGRASHASVYDADSDTIFTYGGRNFEKVFDDLLAYHINTNELFNLQDCDNRPKPPALWGHSLDVHGGRLVLFGGVTADGSLSNQLWFYDIAGRLWSKSNAINITARAFHATAMVDSRWLYVFGGQLSHESLSSDIYQVDLTANVLQFHLVAPINVKPKRTRLAGHRAVYHPAYRSVVIFGGLCYNQAGEIEMSNLLHLYHIDHRVWSTLDHIEPELNDTLKPQGRAFHSMVLVSNFLFIFGGSTQSTEPDDGRRMFVYSLTCHRWIEFAELLGATANKLLLFPFGGLTSHSMVVARGNALFLFGGHSGILRNQMFVLSLPSHLPTSSTNNCRQMCSMLNNCQSCFAYSANVDQSIQEASWCAWSFSEEICIATNSNNDNMMSEQCGLDRIDRGLTLIKYYFPPRTSFPDEVLVTDSRSKNVYLKDALKLRRLPSDWNSYHYGLSIVRLLGFVHPLGVAADNQNKLRLYLSSSTNLTVLLVNKTKELLKTSADTNETNIYNLWADLPLTKASIDDPFLIDLIIRFPVRTTPAVYDYDRLELTWDTVAAANIRLRPYANDELCHNYFTCSSCLSNAACLWCAEQERCVSFSQVFECEPDSPNNNNNLVNNSRQILVNPADCPYCLDHTSCETCHELTWCQWLPTSSLCVRRGRFDDMTNVTSSSRHCARPCDHRHHCDTCLDPSGQCLWCAARRRCIRSASYSTLSPYELCFACHSLASNNNQSEPCSGCTTNFVCPGRCVHGHCAGDPYKLRCECDIGWTGEQCDVDCRCHQHSTCVDGVGRCDRCEHNTRGQFCQLCRPQTFGNATEADGCRPCRCNGHGDPDRGLCHPDTGVCYCRDNTTGDQCDRCAAGYFGDARDGRPCYLDCQHRSLLTNITSGRFGSMTRKYHLERGAANFENQVAVIDCLWIFTTLVSMKLIDKVADYQHLTTSQSLKPIELIIFQSLDINCKTGKLVVYDGLPKFLSASSLEEKTLAVLCNIEPTEDIRLVAQSGFLTVTFVSESPYNGFNASYHRADSLHRTEPSKLLVKQHEPTNISIAVAGAAADHTEPVNIDLLWRNTSDGHASSSQTMHKHHNALVFLGGDIEAVVMPVSLFDLTTKRWQAVLFPPDEGLANRVHYGSALFNATIYLYGGLHHQTNRMFNDLIAFDLDSFKFNKIVPNKVDNFEQPALMSATLTHIELNEDKNALVLLGGYSPWRGYSNKMLIYLIESNRWKELVTSGTPPLGMIGHSAVYNSKTHSIYVFGGVVFTETQKPIVSNMLYVLKLDNLSWHRMHSSGDIPVARYLHHAISLPNYMLVFGGHSTGMDHLVRSSVSIYTYRCNHWHTLEDSILPHSSAAYSCRHQFASKVDFPNSILYHYESCFSPTNAQTIIKSIGRVSLPNDLCRLYSDHQLQCLAIADCSFLVDAKGKSVCFDYTDNKPDAFYEVNAVVHHRMCRTKHVCERNVNCADCLSAGDGQCQWCVDCNHLGRCLPINDTCESFEYNNNNFCLNTSVVEPSQCEPASCLATDCEKCLAISHTETQSTTATTVATSSPSPACVWMRSLYPLPSKWSCQNSSKLRYSFTVGPLIHQAQMETTPPLACPVRCHLHSTCSLCLDRSNGDEAGSRECIWSELTRECLSTTYALVRCENGVCGNLLYRSLHSACPVLCEDSRKASDCLANRRCGWCALNGFEVDGLGLCLNGGLFGPAIGKCNPPRVEDALRRATNIDTKGRLVDNVTTHWHYLDLPKENECRNNHHNCDVISQECVDLDEGFRCRCKSDYKLVDGSCVPICPQGCVFGVCSAPNVCRCNFGYIGADCSLQCQCNGHSTCASPDHLEQCLACHNNTAGKHCDRCRPMFVGDPRHGGACQSCFDYCNRHSDNCFGEHQRFVDPTEALLFDVSSPWFRDSTKAGTLCTDCRNNTEGPRCDVCREGYFRVSEDMRDGCRPCQCNGHGFQCNQLTGVCKHCYNNTENAQQCFNYHHADGKETFAADIFGSHASSMPCWTAQCSRCKDFFYGLPDNGHQCYRHMFIDKEYCFDPNSQEECLRRPQPLLEGRTVFLAVQPRYMNVDIRLVVVVIKGSVDLFIANRHDAFVVATNESNGFHEVYLDKKYVGYQTHLNGSTTLGGGSDQQFGRGRMLPRKPYRVVTLTYGSSNNTPNYFTMAKANDFYWFRNVQYRLEITIPYKVHDLRATRFYLMVRGDRPEGSKWNANYGFVLFRQDQARIDLFVFFSVFCSSFVLFLCLLYYLWHVKRFVQHRRQRQMQAIELENLASRPFARLYISLADERKEARPVAMRPSGEPSAAWPAASPAKKSSSFFRQLARGFKDQPKVHPEASELRPNEMFETKPCLRPVSVEPTANGNAAIVTVFIELPGREVHHNRHRFVAASSLVRMSTQHYRQMQLTRSADEADDHCK